MKAVFISILVVLGLALVATVVFVVNLTGENNALKTELLTVEAALADTMGELDNTTGTLVETQVKLASTEQSLSSTQDDLISTQQELTSTQQALSTEKTVHSVTKQSLLSTLAELDSSQQELSSTQVQLNDARQTADDLEEVIAEKQQQLTVAQETLEGLGISIATSVECYDVELVDNPEATNPTWRELKAFLAQDQTEGHTYILHEYDCSQFSRDIHNNAEAAGIRAAEVHIDFENSNTSHAANAFLTTDFGLVYVDCTEAPDRVARITTEKTYRSVSISGFNALNARNDIWWNSLWTYYYIPSSTGGGQCVTSEIIIYW
ncbi:MAG: hypothetical protein MUO19_03305 [Dehalococcoidales bacterium]|nr:hypothetical protein [Dehalococcoidales bacterium]